MTDPRPHRVRHRAVLAALAAMAVAVALVAVSTGQAARHQRALGWLDGAAAFLRTSAGTMIPWLDANAVAVGEVVTAIAAALALAAWASTGRKAAPVALFGLALSLAVWGEVSLLTGRLSLGLLLFALGLLCAAVLGYWCPLEAHGRRARDGNSPGEPPPRFSPRECAVVVGLTLVALVTRLYALNEVPRDFQSEMIVNMLSSRTVAGLREYMAWGMLSNTNGVIHPFLQFTSFSLLGTSVFSLRFASAFVWTASMPVFYCLLRRIAGTTAAVVATVLLIAAPDQLFWSRSESVSIALIPAVAIVTVALSLRLVERPRLSTALPLTFWIPFSRYFYSPAIVLMPYPLLLYAHSLVFVRGTWRTAVRVIPALAAGVALWVFSLSAAYALFSGGTWRFLNPAHSAGAPVWQSEGSMKTAGLSELVAGQAANFVKNLDWVAASMTYRTRFTPWYERSDRSGHPTLVNVGISVMLVIGLGYLVGQFADRRAFALLVWIGLGILPGVLSLDPAPRRMAVAFPAFYAVAAVIVAAALDLFRTRAGRWVMLAARAAASVGLAVIVWTSTGSHFLLPAAPTFVDEVRRVTQPVFTQSDAIFHNLSSDWEMVLAFAHGDDLFEKGRTPCVRSVGPREWLGAALRQTCDFESVGLRFSLSPEQRRALRAAYNPQRVSFLIREDPTSAPHLELLVALYPGARSTRLGVSGIGATFTWLYVDRAAMDALRTPELLSDPAVPGSGDSTQILRPAPSA